MIYLKIEMRRNVKIITFSVQSFSVLKQKLMKKKRSQ